MLNLRYRELTLSLPGLRRGGSEGVAHDPQHQPPRTPACLYTEKED